MVTDSKIRYCVVIGLILLISCNLVSMVSADNLTTSFDNNSLSPANTSHTVPVAPPKLSPENESKNQEIMQEQDRLNDLQKTNRTFWQKKIDTQLLSLLGSDTFNKTGRISQQDMTWLLASYNVIPLEKIPERFGIPGSTGDLLLVDIDVNKTASVHIVDPYIVNLSGTSGNMIYGWIELSSVQAIASLEGVNQIYLVHQPASYNYIITSDTGIPLTMKKPEVTGEVSAPHTQNNTPSVPSRTATVSIASVNTSSPISEVRTTPGSSLSVTVTITSVMVSVIGILLFKRRAKSL